MGPQVFGIFGIRKPVPQQQILERGPEITGKLYEACVGVEQAIGPKNPVAANFVRNVRSKKTVRVRLQEKNIF